MSNPYIPRMGFYSLTLSIPLQAKEFAGNQVAVFPREQPGEPSPSPEGVIIYFASRPDLAIPLQRVEGGGGQMLVPKTPIGPDIGFFALFEGTEGNHVGLFSPE